MAHQTDEWCECARIEEAVAIYAGLIGTLGSTTGGIDDPIPKCDCRVSPARDDGGQQREKGAL